MELISSQLQKNPEKILTIKVDLKDNLNQKDIEDILKVFKFTKDQFKDASNLVNALFKAILINKDALFS